MADETDEAVIYIIDDDVTNPIRAGLVSDTGVPAVHMSMRHPKTISTILARIRRSLCRGVWIRLFDTNTDSARAARKHEDRTKAMASLIQQIAQLRCPLIVEGQARLQKWQLPDITRITSSRTDHFRTSRVRWCNYLRYGTTAPTDTTHLFYTDLRLRDQQAVCRCGRAANDHAKMTTIESRHNEAGFLKAFWASHLRNVFMEDVVDARDRLEAERDAERATRYPQDEPNEGVDEPPGLQRQVHFEDEFEAYPTEQAKAYKKKVQEMKDQGQKPAKRVKKIMDPDHFDDCGDDLGDLEYLLDEMETWYESPDTQSNDRLAYESDFHIDDVTYWCGNSDEPPRATNHDDLLSMAQYFTGLRRSGDGIYVDVCEIMGGEARTTKILQRRHFVGGRNFDATCGVNLLDNHDEMELYRYLRTIRPLVVVMSPQCTGTAGWRTVNESRGSATHDLNLRESIALGQICGKCAIIQLDGNRHFINELPVGSILYDLPEWQLVAKYNITWVRFHGCMVGLRTADGLRLKKPEEVWASHEILIYRLRPLQCDGSHVHGEASGRDTKPSQIWTWKFARLLADGIADLVWMLEHRHRQQSALTEAYPAAVDQTVKCPGCRRHVFAEHPSHTRVVGECNYPHHTSVEYQCPACARGGGRAASGHTLKAGECRMADPGYRGARASGPRYARDPRVPASTAADAGLRDFPRADDEETPPAQMEPPRERSPRTNGTPAERSPRTNGTPAEERFEETAGGSSGSTAAPAVVDRQEGVPDEVCDTWVKLDNGAWRRIHAKYRRKLFDVDEVTGSKPTSIGTWRRTEVKYADGKSEVIIGNVEDLRRRGDPQRDLGKDWKGTTTFYDDEASARSAPVETAIVPMGVPPPPNPPNNQQLARQDPRTTRRRLEDAIAQVDIGAEWTQWDLGKAIQGLRSAAPGMVQRTLRRMHVRLWHCPAQRMRDILSAAGLPQEIIDHVQAVVDTCTVCRMWSRRGNQPVVALSFTTKFNEGVQLDLLFVDDGIALHIIDLCIKYAQACFITSKEPEAVLPAIVHLWFRVYMPPMFICSDQEGALFSDQGSTWADRWGVALRPKPKGTHAYVIERRNEILRQQYHKVRSQAEAEGLRVTKTEMLDESILAVNALLSVHGTSPYAALFGRVPNLLEQATGRGAAVDDETGGVESSRHVHRLREISVANIVQNQAKSRLELAARTKTRGTGQLLDLRPGDAVDIYRDPPNKDITGWRGPCKIVSLDRLDEGVIEVRWQGRVLPCQVPDVRRSIVWWVFVVPPARTDTTPYQIVLHSLEQLSPGSSVLLGYELDDGGRWKLTPRTSKMSVTFEAGLHVAANDLQLTGVVATRLGCGTREIAPSRGHTWAVIYWWTAGEQDGILHLLHDPRTRILVADSLGHHWKDVLWLQFLGVDGSTLEGVRQLPPMIPNLGGPTAPPDFPMSPGTSTTAPSSSTMRTPPWSTETEEGMTPRSLPEPRGQAHSRSPSQERALEREGLRPGGPEMPSDRATRGSDTPRSLPEPRVPARVRDPTGDDPELEQPARRHFGPPKAPDPEDGEEDLWNDMWEPSGPEWHRDVEQEFSFYSQLGRTIPPDADFTDEGGSTDEWNVYVCDADKTSWEDLELELPREIALLVVGLLEHDIDQDQQVILTMSGQKDDKKGKAVIAREADELSTEDIKRHQKGVDDACLGELKNWLDLGALKMRERKGCTNLMTSRWVIRWKRKPDESLVIKARLCIKGFQDRQQEDLATFSATASRQGQRVVNMLAATCPDFVLFSCDVGSAFLKGLTFEQVSKMTGEPLRAVQLDLPQSAVRLIRSFRGYEQYDPARHCLEMIRPGFGLKDAPRLWSMRLGQVMKKLQTLPLVTDGQLFCRWRHPPRRTPPSTWKQDDAGETPMVTFGDEKDPLKDLVMACSAHVDDLKGAATMDTANCFMDALEAEFGKLTRQFRKFEHCGVVHDQKPSGEVHCTQDHYVKQLRLMALEKATADTEPLTETQKTSYWSLLGGAAWCLVTRADVAIHVGHLQRNAHAPTMKHARQLNAVVKWLKRTPCTLVYKRVAFPWEVVTFPDSAFRATEPDCLAVRAAVTLVVEASTFFKNMGGRSVVLDFYSRKQPRVCRSTFSAELASQDDGISSAITWQVMLNEIAYGPLAAHQIQWSLDRGAFPIKLVACTDNKGLYSALSAVELRPPAEPHLIYLLKSLRERLECGTVSALYWIDTRDMISDALTKGGLSRDPILKLWAESALKFLGDTPLMLKLCRDRS